MKTKDKTVRELKIERLAQQIYLELKPMMRKKAVSSFKMLENAFKGHEEQLEWVIRHRAIRKDWTGLMFSSTVVDCSNDPAVRFVITRTTHGFGLAICIRGWKAGDEKLWGNPVQEFTDLKKLAVRIAEINVQP